MRFPGSKGQLGTRDLTFRADSTIASVTLPQLVLPEAIQRSYFLFQNASNSPMFLEFGSARAHATLTSGVVTSVTVDNAGFGFTRPPLIEFLGGGLPSDNTSFIASGQPDYPSPSNFARAHCVLTTGAVSSIVVDNGGSGYKVAPYVRVTNDPLDLIGCADPSVNSGTGFLLPSGDWIDDSHISVPTDQVAVFCATLTAPFFCRYF